MLIAGVFDAGGAYAKPVTRLSFSTEARQRFLGLIRQNPPQQQQQQFPNHDDDDDVDMLVPDGLLTFFFHFLKP